MNQATKVIVALVVILVIAAGAYYMLSGSPTMMGPEAGSAMNSDIPAATDSVDDFAAAMEAELSAGATAVKAFDADVDASATAVTSAADTSNLIDPNEL